MRTFLYLATGISLALSATPAAAQWHVQDSEDPISCSLYREYSDDGETHLLLSLPVDGVNNLALMNRNWSSVKGREYEFTLVLDGLVSHTIAVGFRAGQINGFAFPISDEVLASMRTSEALAIFRFGTLDAVSLIMLDGSSKAMRQLDACTARMKSRRALQQRQDDALARKREIIPADPFAADPPAVAAPDLSRPGAPRGNPGRWVMLEDMPAAARENRWEGTTGFRVTYDGTGSVIDCEITSSSGHPLLDQTTCERLRERGQFSPGQQRDGQPIGGTYSNRMLWRPIN